MTADLMRVYRDAVVGHAMSFWKQGVCNAREGSTNPIAMDSGWGTTLKKADGTTTDWCGFFVAASCYRAGLCKALRKGFYHVDNVHNYFVYHYGERVPRWVWDDATAAWYKVHELHTARGARRRWLNHAAVDGADLATLDILPGDVVLIDHEGDGRANHITLAESYDPATGVLTTLEGNGMGKVAVSVAADGTVTEGPSHGPSAVRNRRNLTDKAQRRKIFGVGRLSVVDFETLSYAKTDAKPTKPHGESAPRSLGISGGSGVDEDEVGDDGRPVGGEP